MPNQLYRFHITCQALLVNKIVTKTCFCSRRRLFKEFHKEKMFLKNDMKFNNNDQKLIAADHMKDVYDLLYDYKKHSHQTIDIKVREGFSS